MKLGEFRGLRVVASQSIKLQSSNEEFRCGLVMSTFCQPKSWRNFTFFAAINFTPIRFKVSLNDKLVNYDNGFFLTASGSSQMAARTREKKGRRRRKEKTRRGEKEKGRRKTTKVRGRKEERRRSKEKKVGRRKKKGCRRKENERIGIVETGGRKKEARRNEKAERIGE